MELVKTLYSASPAVTVVLGLCVIAVLFCAIAGIIISTTKWGCS